MARNMYSFMNLCFIVRKLHPLSINAVKPIRLLRTSSLCKEEWRRDDQFQNYLSDDKKKAVMGHNSLYDKIRKSSTQSQIMDLVNEYEKTMSGSEAIKALSVLFNLEEKTNDERSDIATKKEFGVICEILRKNIRLLTESEALQALKVLNYYHVPSSTMIIQMLLQIIRNSINNLSVDQLLFLKFLLEKCQKTSLVEALSLAIPIVLDSKMKLDLDTDSVDTLIRKLEYSIKQNHSSTLVSKISDKINDIDTSLLTIDQIKMLLKIFSTVADKELHPILVKLYKKCHRVIQLSIDNIDEDIIKTIINPNFSKYPSCSLYDEILFDTCVTAIISKDMGFFLAIRILQIFNIFGHTNNSLLDYIAAKCFENNSISSDITAYSIKILVYGLSYADYKPVFWDTLKDLLLNEKLLTLSPKISLKLSIYLASLDCYYSPLLAKIFTLNYHLHQDSTKQHLLFHDKVIKLYYPAYEGPWLSNDIIKECQTYMVRKGSNKSLKTALENALGGTQYVLSDVKSMIGCYIDHVVMMRKGGFPIAINNTDETGPTLLDQINPLPDSQVILFIYLPYSGYSRNTQRLTGYWSLLIRTLKNITNYTVIPIYCNMWEKLSEAEQLRYVSQAIRLKSDELSAVVNS